MSSRPQMTQRSDSRTLRLSPAIRADRTRHGLELIVRWRCASWSDFGELHQSQLSQGGLFVGSRMAAPLGTRVQVELTLPDGELVPLTTEVVQAVDEGGNKTPGMALSIVEVDARGQQALERALAQSRAPSRPRSLPPPLPPPPATRAPSQLPQAKTSEVGPPPIDDLLWGTGDLELSDDTGAIPLDLPPSRVPSQPMATRSHSQPIATRGSSQPIDTRSAAQPVANRTQSQPSATRGASQPVATHAHAQPVATRGWSQPIEAHPAPPPPEPTGAPPQFATEVEQALFDELGRRMELLPHAQLGLGLDAGDDEIITAHKALKERYNPNTFARYGAGTAVVIKGLHELIDAAFAQLADLERRRELVRAAQGTAAPPAEELEQQRRGNDARAALRAGLERRVQEACAHRDMGRLDEAIRGFEGVLTVDKKHEYATEELKKLRNLKKRRS